MRDPFSIIRTSRARLSEIHALMQRTYLDSERKKLREEEKELYKENAVKPPDLSVGM